MTQEEKQLLLVDLCGRLPYGMICRITNRDSNYKLVEIDYTYANSSLSFVSCILPYSGYQTSVVDVELNAVKPYLRPMSSMTEEEKEEYCNLQTKFLCSSQYPVTDAYELFDWLNARHFDYRGLIPMGLAIAVTEENNPYKE